MTSRRQAKSIVNTDRIAIRQALAILEEDEGAIIEDTANITIDEGFQRKIRRHSNPASSRRNDNNAIRRASLNSKQQERSHRSNISKAAAAAVAADDVTSCSTSFDGGSTVSSSCSYSCSSLKPDEDREVGGKGKRRSHTRRSKRHPHAHQKSKKEPEGSSSTRDAVNNKLSVRFSKYDQIHDIPHINDLSPEEIQHCWMNEEEYQKIRALEGNTSQCRHERDQLQRKLQQAVFRIQAIFHTQQQRQQQEAATGGNIEYDAPKAIRQVSINYSKTSMKIARFTGISDRVNNVS
eukprot:CAMPEP_0170942726 /NCGR_PEP_ID=MMETSP0735-20130129/24411_1 /TAXON_ID=186038 /ORGANISM="Fragilariopsis kerguelensis, Strain L26-C5" /LENGTH=292 /DNA_ID=CAMNT_0011349773 /DNA_START=55 /DNA_END=930 /DNA_ORIENTATION=+